MDQQRAKELACLLALRRGVSLFSRGHHVYGVHADGRTFSVCGSRQVSELWPKTAGILARDAEYHKSTLPAFRLNTPAGLFEASTWVGLLWNWFRGFRTGIPVSCDEG